MEHQLICENCGKSFVHNKIKRFCSQSCVISFSNKKRWENPEFKESQSLAMSNRQKKIMQNTDARKQISDTLKTKWLTDDIYRSEMLNARNESDEYKINRIAKQKVTNKTQETKDKRTQQNLKRWQNAEYRERVMRTFTDERLKFMSIISKKNWDDAEYKENHVTKMRLKWQDPAYREKMINIFVEKWKDENYAIGHFKNSVKYKDYVFPSGKTTKIQGYENFALDFLLTVYEESDIVTGVTDISKCIGKIMYEYEGVERRYYPDIYIKSENLIIEVKSNFTYNTSKEKNAAKQEACESAGYKYQFLIFDRLKGEELYAHVTLEKGERSAVATLAANKL